MRRICDVAAAAVHCKAAGIVTFNLRHFRERTPVLLRSLGDISSNFLIDLYLEESATVMAKLERQAADRSRTLAKLLEILSATVPDFVRCVRLA